VFNASSSSSALGSVCLYEWDFDGDTEYDLASTESVATHAFGQPGAYNVVLRVTDALGGQTTSDPVAVTVTNRAPIAGFTASEMVASNDEIVSFASHAFDADGEITAWIWDFGDGTTSPESDPAHTYDRAGTYVVTLTVIDDCNERSRLVSITIVVENTLPVATLSADCRVLATGETIRFLDESYDASSSGRIVYIAWDFDDGTYVAGSPNEDGVYPHTYSDPGLYSVVLYVIDSERGMSTAHLLLTVETQS